MFTEKTHAWIAAEFYEKLTASFGERGKKAFIHGTQYYAESRGRRMAQRAIRDGRELTYGTYMEYGEWVNTSEVLAEGIENRSTIESLSPDLSIHITQCPWHAQFKAMGLIDAGDTYCAHLDNSICRGFNPYIVYEVPNTLHKSGFCRHIIRNAGLQEGEAHPKKMEYVKGFDYHCANSYYAYAEVTKAIFGTEGEAVCEAVMADFEQAYGPEMTAVLKGYADTNFNVCD